MANELYTFEQFKILWPVSDETRWGICNDVLMDKLVGNFDYDIAEEVEVRIDWMLRYEYSVYMNMFGENDGSD